MKTFSGKKRINPLEQDFYSSIVAFNIINEEKLSQTQKLHKNKEKTNPQLLKNKQQHTHRKNKTIPLPNDTSKNKKRTRKQYPTKITFTITKNIT